MAYTAPSPTGKAEGAKSTAPDWWTSHPIHASLLVPALRAHATGVATVVASIAAARYIAAAASRPE